MRRFSKALAAIPGVFVGGTEEMKHTVSTTHDAARRCFRSRGLPVLPWRKNRFMQNKWLGPCHRTARDISIGFSVVLVAGWWSSTMSFRKRDVAVAMTLLFVDDLIRKVKRLLYINIIRMDLKKKKDL